MAKSPGLRVTKTTREYQFRHRNRSNAMCLDDDNDSSGRSGSKVRRRNTVKFVARQMSMKLPLRARVQVKSKAHPKPLDMTQALATFKEDFKDDLIASCEAVKTRLEQLQSHYPVLDGMSVEIIQGWQPSETGEIRIAVVGDYNSGKSSFLNALTGHRFLPVSTSLETAVRTRVRHVVKIHGPLSGHPASQTCEKCPKLMKESGPRRVLVEECKGVAAVFDRLRLINRKWRSQDTTEREEAPTLVVFSRIPMFDFLPQTWQVYLEDNPGLEVFTEEQKLQFKEEVMDLSAYICTVSYDRLLAATSTEAFKLISDQDQAKAAYLQDRLLVVVTHFDNYYKALDPDELLNEQQVKGAICESIKQATSRSFPTASVVPVCCQWALTARELMQNPNDHKLKRRALKFLAYHSPSEQHYENGLMIAKVLETASGILTAEKRIVEISRRACNQSNTDITGGCLFYLGAALKAISAHTQGTKELVHAQLRRQHSVHDVHQKFTECKDFFDNEIHTATQQRSPRFVQFQAHCVKEVWTLSDALIPKVQKSFEALEEACKEKLPKKKADKAQLEKEVKPVLENLSTEVMEALREGPFQLEFDQCIREVEEKFQSMRENALKYCTDPQSFQKLPGAKDPEIKATHLTILNETPLALQEQVISLAGKGKGPKQLEKVLKEFQKVTHDTLMSYVANFGETLFKVQYTQYCDHVKSRLREFEEEFSHRMESRQEELEMMAKVKGGHEGDIEPLTLWRDHLEQLKLHLEKKSKEALAKTS